MNYILYNPKSNNEHNDLNIVYEIEEPGRETVKKICLIGLDVREFSESLTEQDRVIVCGGDGTLHHFANDAYGIEFPCPVCVIRSGTGNDFLNDIGQKDSEKLIDIREYLKDLPLVEVNGKQRRCINGVGLGVDGMVCYGVEQAKARTKGKVSYTPIALKCLAYQYKRPSAKVTVDGVVHEYKDVWTVATMKGKYFGGGMMIAPQQDRESGKISIMVMHGGSRLKTLTVFLGVFKGTHVKHTEMIDIFEGYDLKVEFDAPVPLQIDGEVETEVTEYTAHILRPETETTSSETEVLSEV